MPDLPDLPDLPETMVLPSAQAAGAWGDQAAGLRRLMARRLQPAAPSLPQQRPRVQFRLLAQDAALAAWMREHLAVVLGANPSAEPAGPVLLAVHAHAAVLPQALTWAYAQLKRLAQQDVQLAPERRLLPRLHLVLVGVQDAAQAQKALANMSIAVKQHLGVALPAGAWLCSAPPSGNSASDAQGRANLALDFCRLAAELRQWPAAEAGAAAAATAPTALAA